MKFIKISIALIWLCSIHAYSADSSGNLLGGSEKSRIRIEVFSDFECPHCRELYLTVIRPVLRDYSSKDGPVCVVYHEFPLNQHKYSRQAARYAEAASRINQEVLLKTYEALFREQAVWIEDGKIEAVLSKVIPGELPTLKKIMQNPDIEASIKKSLQFSAKNKVNGTPTMLISYPPNRQQRVEMTQAPLIYDTMKRFIDTILSR